MKKSLIVLAALGAFAGAASAQSSVSLFGIVDLSVNNIKNGSISQKSMNSNQLNSNRLGFRGTEDMGGGLKAGFWLEGGMDNDTGSPGGFNFLRRSTLSLMGGFGEIRLGRDYTNTFSNVATFDAYGANGFGNFSNIYANATHAGMGSGYTTAVRANNMIGYFLPGGLGGLYGSVQLSAGEAVRGNKYAGFRLGYAAGPLDVAFATSRTDVGGSSKVKVTNIGGSFNMGFAKVLAQWDQRKWLSLKYTSWQLSTSVPMGQGEFRASYARGDAAGTAFANTLNTNANDANLWGFEYIYNLSKRTAIYGQYGSLNNKGKSNLSLGGVTPTNIAGTAADESVGFKSTAYGVGIRHSF